LKVKASSLEIVSLFSNQNYLKKCYQNWYEASIADSFEPYKSWKCKSKNIIQSDVNLVICKLPNSLSSSRVRSNLGWNMGCFKKVRKLSRIAWLSWSRRYFIFATLKSPLAWKNNNSFDTVTQKIEFYQKQGLHFLSTSFLAEMVKMFLYSVQFFP